MAENLASVLQVPLEYAQALWEAAGGDEARAFDLAFQQQQVDQDGFSKDPNSQNSAFSAADSSSFQPPYAHWSKIWPSQTELPPSWADQRLDTLTEKGEGIIQQANGPCGVLSVIQAELWNQSDDTTTTSSNNNISFQEKLTTAVSRVLARVLSHAKNRTGVILPDGSELSLEAASKQIRTARALVEAVVATLGPNNLPKTTSLVEGPHWLCSSDLMCLLLRGSIGSGHFVAWNATTRLKENFYPSSADSGSPLLETKESQQHIGLLSYTEIEQGIQVADDLKFVSSHVWVAHTGDHFTTLRQLESSKNQSMEKEILLEVYNGLPPAGPKFQRYKLTGDLSLAEPAAEEHTETFRKKRPGQPDDIIQARKTSSQNYKDWTFEVVPAVEDPSVSGPLDEDPDEPVYSFDDPVDESLPWRCAFCYSTRFQTMNFGQNEAGLTCGACGKTRDQAFWSLWQTYDELSPRMKRRARQMYATQMEMIISTLWPKANIDLLE